MLLKRIELFITFSNAAIEGYLKCDHCCIAENMAIKLHKFPQKTVVKIKEKLFTEEITALQFSKINVINSFMLG